MIGTGNRPAVPRLLANLAVLITFALVSVGCQPGAPGPVPTPSSGPVSVPSSSGGVAWSPVVMYRTGDVVEFGGRRWEAVADVAGFVPGGVGQVGVPLGFGQTSGGAGGLEVWVTSLGDSGPGSLREAAAVAGVTWIRFGVDGTIALESPVRLGADTTVDGRGASVTIGGHRLEVRGVSDVIVTNLSFDQSATFDGDDQGSGEDGVLVWQGASRVWLDHLDFSTITDEAIDISRGATDVTVSWSHFHDQDKGVLIGSWGDNTRTDSIQRVTLHHSWFEGTNQRSPRAVRYSQVHVVNNVIEGWTGRGVESANGAEMAVDANVFIAGPQANGLMTGATGSAIGNRSPESGYARVSGNLLQGGAELRGVREPERVFDPAQTYDFPTQPADDALVDLVRQGAGPAAAPRDGAWELVP